MTKTCKICSSEIPNRLLIDGHLRVLTSRRYCLECSPYGYHNTRKLDVPKKDSNACVVCDKQIPLRRRRCGACNTKIRRVRNKLAAIHMLGGKCARCGWKDNFSALEFHHVNGKKDFTIGQVANKSWDSIVDELKKCIILCANCHRVEHSDRDSPRLLEEVQRYNGLAKRIKAALAEKD